ncbi:MAG: hypothetical protein IKQ46_06815 [Bacteroidales bacterium]|jgi:hypothetical protein|nr:hypothetical protein [Bacteroidales bacterium]
MLCKHAAKLKRNKSFNNLDTAKTVGILFDSAQQQNYESAKHFMKTLSDNGIEVEALGMVLNEEMLRYFPPTNNVSLFRLDKLTFFGYPDDERVKPFLSREFDILINLCLDENLCIDYVMGMSKAKFKVSMNLRSEDFADFILQYSPENRPTTDELIVKIQKYLSALRKA